MKISHLYEKKTENLVMTERKFKGITISDMADELGISRHTVEMRLNRHKIEPLFYGSIYPLDTLDKIKTDRRGRPAKPKVSSPASDNRGE